MNLTTLPSGWTVSRLGDLGSWLGGMTPSKSNESFWREGTVPWVSPKDMKSFLVSESEDHITAQALVSTSARVLPSGAVLVVVRSGILAHSLPVGVTQRPMTINQDIKALVLDSEVDSRYVAYWLAFSQRDILRKCSKAGTTVSSIDSTALQSQPVPVAPSSEQHRIVAKIEELFSDLDAGVAALERVEANLARHKASVLKAAVEGRLTERWREEHPDVEPASVLLDRALEQRRATWGKFEPANAYRPAVTIDPTGLPGLPEGWCWTTLDALAHIAGGVTKGQRRHAEGPVREVPYLRVANVQRGYLDLSVMKSIEATEREITALRLIPGDVLFTEGGDRDKLGRGWVWNGEIDECIHQNHVFRARLVDESIQPKFISYHGNSFGKTWFLRTGKQSVNLASINMTILKNFPVALPPAAEQAHIVRIVDAATSLTDTVSASVGSQMTRGSLLRQSILCNAFEGRLVPQDPSDEPASALLDRVRAEKAASEAAKPITRRGRKPKSASGEGYKLVPLPLDTTDQD